MHYHPQTVGKGYGQGQYQQRLNIDDILELQRGFDLLTLIPFVMLCLLFAVFER